MHNGEFLFTEFHGRQASVVLYWGLTLYRTANIL